MTPTARGESAGFLKTIARTGEAANLPFPVHPHMLRPSCARRPNFRLAIEAAGIYLDYSKNRITDETLRLLLQLARESGLRDRIDAMFRGGKINVSENRAVLHVALRAARRHSFDRALCCLKMDQGAQSRIAISRLAVRACKFCAAML
jgi:Phosphoglucose isomerase